MFDYDYTFCSHKTCGNQDCYRHWVHTPVSIPISIADLHNDPACPDYWKTPDPDELIERVQRLNLRDGEVLCCFYDPSMIDGDAAGELHAKLADAVPEGRVFMLPSTIDVAALNRASEDQLVKAIRAMSAPQTDNKRAVTTDEIGELVGQIVDIFEDFLEAHNVDIVNDEKDEDPDAAIIYGTDYGKLQTALESTLYEWDLFEGWEMSKSVF